MGECVGHLVIVFVSEHEVGHVQGQCAADVPDGVALHHGLWEADDVESVDSVEDEADAQDGQGPQTQPLVSVVVVSGLGVVPRIEDEGERVQRDDERHDQVSERR